MSELDRLDRLMLLGLDDARRIEPSNAQIQAVLRRVSPPRPVWRAPRRLAIAFALVLTLCTGTALAIPQSRDALLDAFGAFKDFFSGGQPPGESVPSGEPRGQLNWFGGGDVASGTVIAQAGSARLVAYRHGPTGLACIGYGLALEDCRTDQVWNEELARTRVALRGPLPDPDATGRLPLVGITADDVTAVEIRYADGSVERADGVSHGFVLFAEGTRRPTELVAYDEGGGVVQTIDIRDLQWVLTP